MARPMRDGVLYFSKDTDFYEDDKVKLLRAEFGAKGMYLLDYLLCDLYRQKGYFMSWGKNKCFLVSDGAGCGCDPGFTEEFVAGCVRCSFFDKRVFDMFGVLTSAGIQRRYVRALSNREEIPIQEEYLLLDPNDPKDVPAGASNKLTIKSDKISKTPVNVPKTPLKIPETTQSKVKKSKAYIPEAETAPGKQTKFIPPTVSEVSAYCRERHNTVDPERFVDHYTANGWMVGKTKMKDWKAAVRTWERSSRDERTNGKQWKRLD